jgi:nicotinamide-nucleotide amidase
MSAKNVIELLEGRNMKLALAESLTGGLLASDLVSVPGASNVLLGSLVAYNTGLKSALLGVNSELLSEKGAVDPEVAIQMAEGVRSRFSLSLLMSTDQILGLSTTGVAGPDEQDGQPVGTVYVAIAGAKGAKVWAHVFSGDRAEIRKQTVAAAFEHIREYFSA